MYTEQLTQRYGLYNSIPPQTLNGAAANTGGIIMGEGSKFQRAFFRAVFGATVGGTVTLSLQESDSTNTWPGNGVASPFSGSGGTQTQLVLAPPVANTEYTLECRAEDMSPNKTRVRLNCNVSANANLIAITAHGDECQHKPGNKFNDTQISTQNVVT